MGSLTKIAIITTSRSDWVSLAPIAKEIDRNTGFDLILIAGAYHLVKDLGYSFRDIKEEGFRVIKKLKPGSKNYQDMFFFANGLQKNLIKILRKFKPDYVVIIGDRIEQLESAIAAKSIDCKIVHLCGGDLSGNLDNEFRYAISALADYHYVKTRQSQARLISRGIDRNKIKIVGLPAFDFIKEIEPALTGNRIKQQFNLSPYEYILVLFNPDDYDDHRSFLKMRKILNSLIPIKKKKVVIYPNGDAGSVGIIKAIKVVCGNDDNTISYQSLAPSDFILLEKYAALMVGNSSSSLWEAPVFGTPVISLGGRQSQRECLLGVEHLCSFDKLYDAAQRKLLLPLKRRREMAKRNRAHIRFGETAKLVGQYIKESWEKGKI